MWPAAFKHKRNCVSQKHSIIDWKYGFSVIRKPLLPPSLKHPCSSPPSFPVPSSLVRMHRLQLLSFVSTSHNLQLKTEICIPSSDALLSGSAHQTAQGATPGWLSVFPLFHQTSSSWILFLAANDSIFHVILKIRNLEILYFSFFLN